MSDSKVMPMQPGRKCRTAYRPRSTAICLAPPRVATNPPVGRKLLRKLALAHMNPRSPLSASLTDTQHASSLLKTDDEKLCQCRPDSRCRTADRLPLGSSSPGPTPDCQWSQVQRKLPMAHISPCCLLSATLTDTCHTTSL
jgi:hypothetical protein